jgi:hypothetical protein
LFALDFDLDGGGLARADVTQLSDPQVAVAPRNVEEEVADSAEAGGGRGFGGFRADAPQRAKPLLEDAGAGPVNGSVEKLGAT